jgi:hypothetical protein
MDHFVQRGTKGQDDLPFRRVCHPWPIANDPVQSMVVVFKVSIPKVAMPKENSGASRVAWD